MRRNKLLLVVGLVLVAASIVCIIGMEVSAVLAQKEAARIVSRLETVMPKRHAGIKDALTNMTMPAFSVDGKDFIGVLEIPVLGRTLPVSSRWDTGTLGRYPCRFTGTAYDGSLIIGGSDRAGQFRGFDTLNVGATVTVTDMTGAVFTYEVKRIDRASHAGAEVLTRGEYDLVLFVQDAFAMEYIIVRCA